MGMKGLLTAFGIDEPPGREASKATAILLWAPVALTTWRYYGAKAFYLQHQACSWAPGGNVSLGAELYTFLTAFVLFGLVSLLIIRLGFRESLAAYGLRLGEWRFGLAALAVLGPVMVLLALMSSRNPQFLAEYPLDRGACLSVAAFALHATAYLVYYIGFEIFFRGFVQQGLAPRLGVWPAILVQTALSCLVHIGKPDGEIYGAILGGVVFGLVAARSRSLLWVILIHWVLGISLDLAICLR
jgi:membrane protease YdiL (CAAX protease family)